MFFQPSPFFFYSATPCIQFSLGFNQPDKNSLLQIVPDSNLINTIATQAPHSAASQQKKYNRTWTKAEVEEVFTAVSRYCLENNTEIEKMEIEEFSIFSNLFKQSPEQIMKKVNEINTSQTLRPGIWSIPEDEMLVSILNKGCKKWGMIANLLNKEIHKSLKIRTGKMCKERWNNYLNPSINRGPWTTEEDEKALKYFCIYGNKWSTISKFIDNRTESAVKNRIKSLQNKLTQNLKAVPSPKAPLISLNQGYESVSPRSGQVVSTFASLISSNSFLSPNNL